MKKSPLSLIILMITFLVSTSSIAANRSSVSVKIAEHATFRIKGNSAFIEAFKEAYSISEVEAINFLIDSECAIDKYCKIKDKGLNRSKFFAHGSVSKTVKSWKKWRTIADN